MMRIQHINTSDTGGGAAIAAYRLHIGLQTIGVDSRMIVLKKGSHDEFVKEVPPPLGSWLKKLNWRLDDLPRKLYRRRSKEGFWSINWVPFPVTGTINAIPADIFHLHWIGSGFVPVSGIGYLNKPIIWTLHDEWAYTGGCHYSDGSEGYLSKCGSCPQLGSRRENDLSRFNWNRKFRAYSKVNITVVAPSHWLAARAKMSSLLKDRRVEVIPNGIATEIYRQRDKQQLREKWGLPQNKHLIMFGAMSSTSDTRKGFHLLQPALRRVGTDWQDRAELLVFGGNTPADPPDFGMHSHYFGTIPDQQILAELYAAADIFVAPSLQDNLPNTILEALACGTPCAAFNIGGIPDLIEHQHNGYLATPFDVDDLAHGIQWVLEDEERHARLSERARQKVVREFALEDVARRYRSLYEEVLPAK